MRLRSGPPRLFITELEARPKRFAWLRPIRLWLAAAIGWLVTSGVGCVEGITTLAVGEEGGWVTTLAIGEEGGL